MLRPGTELRGQEINVVSNFAGLGDHIARLPAFKWVTDTYPHVKLNIFWHDYALDLMRFVLPDTPQLTHWPISRLHLADESLALVDFNYNRVSPLALDLTYHAFLLLADRLPPNKEAGRLLLAPNSPHAIFTPSDYVVLTPEFTSAARQWPVQSIQETADWLVSVGLTPVLLGTKTPVAVGNGREIPITTQEITGDKIIDLRGETTLIEALGVIQGAKAIAGVDGGLLYLAGMTKTPRIRGMTTVLPEHRLAYGHSPLIDILSDASLACRGCQSQVYYVKHDFKDCLYKDYTCTKHMTSDKFIKALKEVLHV